MKNKTLLFRLCALVAAMMCALGASAAEAYANLIPADSTLTFYYDNLRSTRTGTTYDLNTGSNMPEWSSESSLSSVTRVVFDSSFRDARPTSTFCWFYNFVNLTSISGWEYLNTSEVTNMTGMFFLCYNMTSLDVSHFNTANVTNMGSMFDSCSGLTSLDVSCFNTAKVTDMAYMFEGCAGLTDLDLSCFNTSKVTDMSFMFNDNPNLSTIYVGSGWNTDAVTSSTNMFYKCYSLVGGMGTTYNSGHVGVTYAHIDGGPSNPGYFTGKEAYACYTSDNKTLTFYYDKLRSTRPGTTYDLNSGENNPDWYTSSPNSSIKAVVFDPSFAGARPTTTKCWFSNMYLITTITGMEYLNTSEVTNMNSMFYNCYGLTSLDLRHFNTTNVTDMYGMFNYCDHLSNIDVSGFNTTNVTNMIGTFQGCRGLTSLDLSNFNTAKVTNMSSMFASCTGLTNLDLSSFNTTNVTSMGFMFSYCSGLTSLDLSNFNTSNVTNISGMFSGCSGLTSLDVSGFNTEKVEDMGSMFSNCTSLTSLDLSSFNTSKVESMYYMFEDNSNLTTIYVGSEWSTAAVSTSYDMFSRCTSLVGGMGTAYSASNPKDKTYAHIDGGPSNPGYFTDINAAMEPYAVYTPENTTLTFYCDGQRNSRPGTTYDLNEGSNFPGWYSDGTRSSVTQAVFDPSFDNARPTTTYAWFFLMENLQSITGIEYLNTTEVNKMGAMFMACGALTSIDLSHFNTEMVTDMFNMFYGCSSLQSLDVGTFNTASVTDMRGMFRDCSALTSLDLTNFDTRIAGNTSSMFAGCTSLTTIYAGDEWSTAEALYSNEMFYGCTSLVGGKGTTYDPNHVDKAYAHIDGGPSNPGYFTDKSDFLRGDVDGDGFVKISDVTALIDYLLTGNAAEINLGAADCDMDGDVKISDVTELIDYLLRGFWW